MKPTVLIATGVMNAGGTESLIMEMLRQSTGRVRYVMLIHYEGEIVEGVFDAEIRSLGVAMHYIQSLGSQGVGNYLKSFEKVVSGIGHVDIVHSHLNASGGIVAMAAKCCGIERRICHCHADIHYTGNFVNRVKQEISLAVMKALIDVFATERWACSDAAWHRLFMPWRRKRVVSNMIDVSRYLTAPGSRESARKRFGLGEKFVVGAVGRVAPIKNYEVIIKALARIPDAEFVCFGRFSADNPYCAALLRLVESLDLTPRVHWMGNSKDVAADIHCLDVFVMPSFTEGFGMAAIEAQAAGLPAVVSTGAPDIIDANLGLVKFVRPDDVAAWVEAINQSRNMNLPDNGNIETAMRSKNFDSRMAVKQIEEYYCKSYE